METEMSNSKKITFIKDVFASKNVEELKKVIKEYGLKPLENWKEFGEDKNIENSYTSIKSQKSQPIPALSEPIINGQDAIIQKRLQKKGLDPRDDAFDDINVRRAMDLLFGTIGGDIDTLSYNEQEEISDLLKAYITGYRSSGKSTNLVIKDNGCGQHPHNFEDTFMSITGGSKKGNNFVQGMYHVGSTAVIPLCDEGYKVILTSRKPGVYTMSITRKVVKSMNQPEAYYYLKPITVEKDDYFDFDYTYFYKGSLIKLFGFGKGNSYLDLKSAEDLKGRLNDIISELYIPLEIIDTRKTSMDIPESVYFRGKLYDIQSQVKDENIDNPLEPDFPHKEHFSLEDTFDNDNVDTGKIEVDIYLFKKNRNPYSKDYTISYTVNGQTHAKYSYRRLKAQDINYNFIATSVFVNVKLDNLRKLTLSRILKSSRNNLAEESEVANQIIQRVEDIIKNNEALKEHNKKRREKRFNESVQDNIMDKMYNYFPEMLSLKRKTKNITKEDLDNMRDDHKDEDMVPTYFGPVGKAKTVDITKEGKKDIYISTNGGRNFFHEEGDGEVAIEGDYVEMEGTASTRDVVTENLVYRYVQMRLKVNDVNGEVGIGHYEECEVTLYKQGEEMFKFMLPVRIVEKSLEDRLKEYTNKTVGIKPPKLHLVSKEEFLEIYREQHGKMPKKHIMVEYIEENTHLHIYVARDHEYVADYLNDEKTVIDYEKKKYNIAANAYANYVAQKVINYEGLDKEELASEFSSRSVPSDLIVSRFMEEVEKELKSVA